MAFLVDLESSFILRVLLIFFLNFKKFKTIVFVISTWASLKRIYHRAKTLRV